MTSLVTTLQTTPALTQPESQKTHVTFLPESEDTGLSPLAWDASLVEEHSFAVQLTTLPVESGSQVTDHAIRQPKRLTLTLLQTNDPIVPGFGKNGSLKEPEDRVGAALAWLENAQDNVVLLSVFTSLRSYGNMVVERFRVTRDAPRGRVLSVVVEAVELVVATSVVLIDQSRASATPTDPRAQNAKDQGAKPATPASAEQAVETTLMHDGFFGVFSDVVPGLKSFDARVTP